MFKEVRAAQTRTSYSTGPRDAEVRLPTLECFHSKWVKPFRACVAARVTIDGIIGAHVYIKPDIRYRSKGPYPSRIDQPIGYGSISGYGQDFPASLIRDVLQEKRLIMVTRSRLTTHTSIFESDMIEWLANECARQQERFRWGLPTATTRTYIDVLGRGLHATPHPDDHDEMESHRAEMQREKEFAEYWAQQFDAVPMFAV